MPTICDCINSFIKECVQFVQKHFRPKTKEDSKSTQSPAKKRVWFAPTLTAEFHTRGRETPSCVITCKTEHSPNPRSRWSITERNAFWDIIQDHLRKLLEDIDENFEINLHSICCEDDIDFTVLDPTSIQDYEICRVLIGCELWKGHYVCAVKMYRLVTTFFEILLNQNQGKDTVGDNDIELGLYGLKDIFLTTC
uniref:Uncharacterized protein n=1 Tax=Clytia hemisphaerica TaxID=252671 RepID=A0A7M5U1A5_9CNID